MAKQHYSFDLDTAQETKLNELREMLNKLPIAAHRYNKKTGLASEQLAFYNNTLGIFGGRGSGKSTLLQFFYEGFVDPCGKIAPEKPLLFLPPIDCSSAYPVILRNNLPPGLAILLTLKQLIQSIIETENNCNYPPALKALIKQQKEKQQKESLCTDTLKSSLKDSRKRLDTIIDYYTRLVEGYRDLYLELSSTPDDYSHYVTKGVEERLKLRKMLSDWFEAFLAILKAEAVVVFLDDFDLVRAEDTQHWFFSLSDELNQKQMFFVITADFFRLEKLLLDEGIRFDDLTTRALVNKLVPVFNRLNLENWPPQASSEFHLKAEQDSQSPTLAELVDSSANFAPSLSHLVNTLLPKTPRGLRDLYISLNRRKSEITQGNNNRQEKTNDAVDRQHQVVVFLQQLATCRRETILARRLTEIPLADWVNILHFQEEISLSPEDWGGVVTAAQQRPAKTLSLPPLRALKPVTTMRDVSKALQTPDVGGTGTALPERWLEQALALDAPDDLAPLRHNRLQTLPLRDAKETDRPLWAELLIDCGLSEPRNRIQFALRWKPLAQRLQFASFRLMSNRQNLRGFLEDHREFPAAGLCWLKLETPETRIGWVPLLDALRGEHSPMALLDELGFGARHLASDSFDLDTPEALGLLPDQIWALVLLIDGLSRCPWHEFSQARGLNIIAYLGLATAFGLGAYLYGLHGSKVITKVGLTQQEKPLVDMLAQRNPLYLSRMHEEELLAYLAQLLNNPKIPGARQKQQGQSLFQAAQNYINSPAFQAIATSLERYA